jgi:hypothetical protein
VPPFPEAFILILLTVNSTATVNSKAGFV